MAVNIPGVPFKLTPQDMGMPDLINAMQQGLQIPQAYQNILAAQLANQKSQTLMPFVQPQAQAELTKAQQYNQYYPQDIESQIGLRGAQKEEAQALANLHNPQAEMQKLLLEQYKKEMAKAQQGGQVGGIPTVNGMPGQPDQTTMSGDVSSVIPQSNQLSTGGVYGVQSPALTAQDILNNKLFGIDTYSKRQQLTLEQQNKQLNSFNDKMTALNTKIGSNIDSMNLFNQYDKLMDETFASGPYGQLVPSVMSGGQQMINNLTSRMTMPALRNVRDSAGGAIRNVPELNAALNTKPQLGWSKKTRELYKLAINAEQRRDLQNQQFTNFVKNNPYVGLDSQTADVAFDSFQRHFPLVSDQGRVQPWMATGDTWKYWTTPEAVQAIKTKGDYDAVKTIADKIKSGKIKLPEFKNKKEAMKWATRQDIVINKALLEAAPSRSLK